MVRQLLFISFLVFLLSCKNTGGNSLACEEPLPVLEKSIKKVGEQIEQKRQDSLDRIAQQQRAYNQIEDAEFIDIESLSDYFVLEIKYATPDNFLKEAVYSCAKCYVRGVVAKALIAANKDLMEKGYRIQFFDCYRPHSVQKKMWEIYPVPGYVANPRGGSVHNRGAAIDITLTDLQGNEIDMGTPYDHFGKEAHHSYQGLPEEVLANRKILKETMQQHGFTIIRSEWWHYNYGGGKKFKISDFRWECE